MVVIMYVKNLDDENKVCCSLLDCDEKDDTLKHLASLEKALNEEAMKKGYVTGEFVSRVLKEVLGTTTVYDPEAKLKNFEINIF